MPAVARLGDKCSGHGCFPPRPNKEASPDVFINDIAVHRQSDEYEIHCCSGCHGGFLSEGSKSVFINDLECSYVGAPVSCGSVVEEASPDVFVGVS